MTLVVTGLSQVVGSLHAAADDLGDLDAAPELARDGALLMSRYAPVDKGDLSRSFTAETDGPNRATAGTRLHYAGPINSGVPSRNIRPTRFRERAQAELDAMAVGQVEDSLTETLRGKGLL